MMIILAGQMTVNPAIVQDMLAAIAAMRDQVLAEQGCHHYSLLMEDPAIGLVNVTETWRDDDALALHMTQAWIVDFMKNFASEIRSSTVQIYDVASVRPLAL